VYRYRAKPHAAVPIGVRAATGTFTTRPFPEWTVGAVARPDAARRRTAVLPAHGVRPVRLGVPQSLDAGVNLYMAAAAARRGCSSTRSARARCRRIPAVCKDIADGRGSSAGITPTRPTCTCRPRRSRSIRPGSRSHRVTFLTLRRARLQRLGGPAARARVYPRLIARADMIGSTSTRCRSGAGANAFRARLRGAARARRARRARARPTSGSRSAGMEFCNGRPDSTRRRSPIRAEAWLAIAGGARGIGYFPDHWQPPRTSSHRAD
jgi:hypothetical protein